MHIHFFEVVRISLALLAGLGIGLTFGWIQQSALRRNEARQQSGELNNGWAVMPGSMRRVAGLMIALVLIQLICPLLFSDGIQWWVSGGLCLGYGSLLYRRLRHV